MLAINQQLITTADLDRAVLPLLRTLLKLGIIGKNVSHFPKETSISSAQNRTLARRAATESFVLLKNNDPSPSVEKRDV